MPCCSSHSKGVEGAPDRGPQPMMIRLESSSSRGLLGVGWFGVSCRQRHPD